MPLPPGPGRVLQKTTPPANDVQHDHRELTGGYNPTIQACFEACWAYFAPDNTQFFFNVIQSGTNKTCQCCPSADVLVPTSGGQAFANCIPGTNLALASKISSTKARPGKALIVKATVKSKDTKIALTGLGLAISFPHAYVTPEKAGSWPRKGLLQPVQTTAAAVVWPEFDLAPGKKRTFKAAFRVSRSTPPMTVLTFEVAVLQAAGAAAGAGADVPYCPRPAPYPAKAKVLSGGKRNE
jgi:hypothetical protein